MNLTIDETEALTLLGAIDNYLPELEFTLSRVDRPRERHALVVQDELLRALRERIAAALAADQAAAP